MSFLRAPLVLVACCFALAASAAPKLMDWPNLLGRPLPTGAVRIAYGRLPDEVGDLWLPAAALGPHPVVLMVHGGCWLSSVANLTIMNYAAADLARRGFAVWNIEYRGVDRPGGGYPGTFEDVAAGADALRGLAPKYRLQLGHVVALGHSAGGHLVLWLAARGRIGRSSPLHARDPLPIAGVVSLGGLPDLQAMRDPDICGPGTVDRLAGPPSARRPDVWSDTSPAELGAGHDREVLIDGADDGLARPAFAAAYAAKMRPKGADIRTQVVPDTGHVELIAPGTVAWDAAVKAVEALSR